MRSKREPWSSRRYISFGSFTSFCNNSSSCPLILERRAPLCGFAAMSPVSRYRRRKLRMNAKLTLISATRGGHRSKCFRTWSEQTGSLFRSTRWDKGFHGCIRSGPMGVRATLRFSNRLWIAGDGWFRWFYDRNRPKALFYWKKDGWLNKLLVCSIGIEAWARTIGSMIRLMVRQLA